MDYTQQQKNIIAALLAEKNIAVNSGAGTGKTATIVEAVIAYLNDNPYRSVRLLAFNTSAAQEMWARLTVNKGERLPAVLREILPLDTLYTDVKVSVKRDLQVWAGTLNSLGYQLLMYPNSSPKGRFLTVTDKKYAGLFNKHIVGDEQLSPEVRQEFYKSFRACLDTARQNLAVERELLLSKESMGVNALDSFMAMVFKKQGFHPVEFIAKKILTILRESVDLYRNSGQIDFGDQLWLPYVLDLRTPYYSLVVVDEVQDVDPCQRWMVEKFHRVSQSQVMIVGDPHQAIYAWRGADVNSMQLMTAGIAATELPLSENFRCPVTNIRIANQWHPKLRACSSATESEWVKIKREELPMWIRSQKEEITVLCRRNKPLGALAAECRELGIPFRLGGGDLARELIEKLDESVTAINPECWIEYLPYGKIQFKQGGSFNIGDVHLYITLHRNAMISKMRAEDCSEGLIDYFVDMMDTLLVMVKQVNATTYPALREKVKEYFTDDVRIKNQGLTIHRAKGGQWKNVVILDADEMISSRATTWANKIQEWNGWYVASTRTEIGGTTVYTVTDPEENYPVPPMIYDEMYCWYLGIQPSSVDELNVLLDPTPLIELINRPLPEWV